VHMKDASVTSIELLECSVSGVTGGGSNYGGCLSFRDAGTCSEVKLGGCTFSVVSNQTHNVQIKQLLYVQCDV